MPTPNLADNEWLSSCTTLLPLSDLEEFTEKTNSGMLSQAPNIKMQRKHVQICNDTVKQIYEAYNELPKTSEAEAANGTLLDRIEMTTDHFVRSHNDG